MKLDYSPEINLGNILQSFVVIGSIISAVIFWDHSVQAQSSRISMLEQQITTLDARATQDRAENKAFAAEVRASLDKIIERISDLKASVGGRNGPR